MGLEFVSRGSYYSTRFHPSYTTHPFEFLGELDDSGTVRVGKRADLLLLEANPLESITNTRKITGVMLRGRWLSKTEIQKGLYEVAAFYKTLRK